MSNLLTPSKHIVVNHFDVLCSEHLDNFKVQMQSLHKHPGKCGQEEVVQKRRNHFAKDLERKKVLIII